VLLRLLEEIRIHRTQTFDGNEIVQSSGQAVRRVDLHLHNRPGVDGNHQVRLGSAVGKRRRLALGNRGVKLFRTQLIANRDQCRRQLALAERRAVGDAEPRAAF
jgi:hypothetical protein